MRKEYKEENILKEIKNQLGIALRTLRTGKNLKQSEIAKHLGISVSAYSHYECGERTPGIDILLMLAKLHKININYLIFLACNDMIDGKKITAEDIYTVFPTELALPQDEQTILNIYRSVTDTYRKDILLFCYAAHECSV